MMGSIVRLEADVVVLGSGPAGSTFALNLAGFQRVLVLEKFGAPSPRIGESLPAAAGRLLRDMGLWEAFLSQEHQPSYLSRSVWGSDDVLEQDAIRNLDGHGWHLDRSRFDIWLQQIAWQRGAALITQTRGLRIRRHAGIWRLEMECNGKPLFIEAKLLVDASGRNAFLAKQLGRKREGHDKLVCGWVYGQDCREREESGGGMSDLHAEAGGWWYSSSLPNNGRILAFYTDADLPDAQSAHGRDGLLARLATVPKLKRQLDSYGFVAGGEHGFCAAYGASMNGSVGEGWISIGDAALTFDPLSSQGLFNALYTGLAGAEAAHGYLRGDSDALSNYQTELGNIQQAYVAHLGAWYGQETRWRDHPFWQRRQSEQTTSSYLRT